MKLAKGYFKNEKIVEIYKGSNLVFEDRNWNKGWTIDKFVINEDEETIALSDAGVAYREKIGKNKPVNLNSVVDYFIKNYEEIDEIGNYEFIQNENGIDYAEFTKDEWKYENSIGIKFTLDLIKVKCSYPTVRELDWGAIDTLENDIELPNCEIIRRYAILDISNQIKIYAPKCTLIEDSFSVVFSNNSEITWVLKKGCKHGDLHGPVTYVD